MKLSRVRFCKRGSFKNIPVLRDLFPHSKLRVSSCIKSNLYYGHRPVFLWLLKSWRPHPVLYPWDVSYYQDLSRFSNDIFSCLHLIFNCLESPTMEKKKSYIVINLACVFISLQLRQK